MFDPAKIMFGQRVIQYTHGGICKNESIIKLIVKIIFRNLLSVAL